MQRKPETIAFWRGRLPHWEVEDGRYFVTIHVAGAIPRQGHDRIYAIAAELGKLKGHEDARRLQMQRRIFAEMEAWLDRTTRVDYLRNAEIAQIIIEAIAHRQQREWQMYEFVVMPSHVHLFFEISGAIASRPAADGRLKSVLEQFKRWTGHEAGSCYPWTGMDFGRTSGSITGLARMKKTRKSLLISGAIRRKQDLSRITWIGLTDLGARSRWREPSGTQ